jgi:hypothetical protein
MIFLSSLVVFTEMESSQPMLNMLSNGHAGDMGVSSDDLILVSQERGRATYG